MRSLFESLTLTILLRLIQFGSSVGPSVSSFPAITSITPWFGGVEGGTSVTIRGFNFSPTGLWSEISIYFGNNLCAFDRYHSDDNKLVCITPSCTTPRCLSSDTWGGSETVAVYVYVTTVEGIVSAYTSYQYSGYWTPGVNSMSHTAWATGMSFVNVRAFTSSLDDFSITIGGKQYAAFSGSSIDTNQTVVNMLNQNAIIGNDESINNNTFSSFYSNEKVIYFQSPPDISAGFYNVTVALQNDFSNGYASTGNARMYAGHLYSYYYYFKNFDATLSGTPYSICIFPVVSSVYPRLGSLAGGNEVTISGYGFSTISESLQVYVGGIICDVISSSLYSIKCKTRPNQDDLLSLLTPSYEVNKNLISNTTRGFGSPGWWVKMWDGNDAINKRIGNDAYVKKSFGWHQSMYFSLYNLYSSNWPTTLGYTSNNAMVHYYASDIAAVLQAPYTGYYTFYMCTDDTGDLYMSKDGVGINEQKIASCPTYCIDANYYMFRSQISSPIALNKGDRIYLRIRTV